MQQDGLTAIAQTHPDDLRRDAALPVRHQWEVLVLGDDNHAMRFRMFPYNPIIRRTLTESLPSSNSWGSVLVFSIKLNNFADGFLAFTIDSMTFLGKTDAILYTVYIKKFKWLWNFYLAGWYKGIVKKLFIQNRQ